MTKPESCKQCRFFFTEDPKGVNGFCKRYPPTAFTKPIYNNKGHEVDTQLNSYWPPIAENKWCGEFKFKEYHEKQID